MKNFMKASIKINRIGNWSYFLWFILGFDMLDHLKVKIRCDFLSWLSRFIRHKSLLSILRKAHNFFFKDRVMMGLYKSSDKRIVFAIDHFDSPFSFDYSTLKKCDVYFKMQCPKTFNRQGFELAPGISIPWMDCIKKEEIEQTEFATLCKKIRPLCIGPRRLCEGLNKTALIDGYNDMLKDFSINKEKILMAYFGNAKGPVLKKCQNNEFDPNDEGQLLFRYKGLIEHPNIKRKIACDLLNTNNKDFDLRIVSLSESDSANQSIDKSKYVPLSSFSKHISHFRYNLNISGYRLSIPTRFMESFAVGTAIVTDQLSVKWYLPFDSEVFETVKMGYLLTSEVDWATFVDDINSLPSVSSCEVRELFDKKWSPSSVAKYMVGVFENI